MLLVHSQHKPRRRASACRSRVETRRATPGPAEGVLAGVKRLVGDADARVTDHRFHVYAATLGATARGRAEAYERARRDRSGW